MLKCVFCYTLLISLPPLTRSLFIGDNCHAEGKAGVCQSLTDCEPLLELIRNAGTPLPSTLTRRLQRLSCGFDRQHPLVCCPAFTNCDGSTSGQDSFTHPTRPNSFEKPNWGSWGNPDIPSVSSERPDLSQDGNRKGEPDSNVPPDVRRHPNLKTLPTNCGVFDSDRIIGGNRTKLFEMPWMALLSYKSSRGTKLSCGGTLITKWYVLTAAHCVSFLGSRLKLSGVVLGEHDIRSDPDCEREAGDLLCAPNAQTVNIHEVIAHPGYSPQTLFDDIALVRLSEPANLGQENIKPICLPITPALQSQSLEGTRALVSGWGATEDGLQSPVLLTVYLPVISNRECQAAFNGSPHIYNRQICAGGVQDRDSCAGDSGGPLIYPGPVGEGGARYVQRGIVSYGSKQCGLGGLPGVYTRVGHYMDWILDNIKS